MSAKINVIGKSRDAIGKLLQRKRPEELLDIIYELATLEPFFSLRTVAIARGVPTRKVKAMCKDGSLPYHEMSPNNWRVPLSSVREWDENTAFKLEANGNGSDHHS